MNASVFTSYKYTMNAMLPHPDAEATLGQVALAGSASGIFTSCVALVPLALSSARSAALMQR